MNVDGLRNIEPHLDLSHNTGLCSVTLGVPTYRNARFITLWLSVVIGKLNTPVLKEISFSIFPIAVADAQNAEAMLTAIGWSQLVQLLVHSRFECLRKVNFVDGHSVVYNQGPSTFLKLQPLLRKVVCPAFEPLVAKGVQLVVCCA